MMAEQGAVAEGGDTVESPLEDTGAMEKKSMEDTRTGIVPAVQVAGSYEAYAQEKLARATDGDVVLFFHAPWCPTCRSADSAITATAASIPSGFTILKTDYDSNTRLRQVYGVTSQHTFVQVDASGNLIKKWSGSASVVDIVAQVK